MNNNQENEEIFFLTSPDVKYRDAYAAYKNEFAKRGIDMNGLQGAFAQSAASEALINEKSTTPNDSSFTFLYIRESDGIVVGTVNIRNENTDVLGNIGYSIRPSLQNQGFGTEMLAQAIEVCRFIGMTKLVAAVAEDNPSSIRILEKNNFRFFKTTCDSKKNSVIKYYTLDI